MNATPQDPQLARKNLRMALIHVAIALASFGGFFMAQLARSGGG